MVVRGRRIGRWALLACCFMAASTPNPAAAIFGFKVGGFCLVGCGSDSAVSRWAGQVGAGFAEQAITNLGAEGRRVADYANAEMSETLDQKIEALNQVADIQRAEFRSDLEDVSTQSLAQLRSTIDGGIDRLAAELDVAISKMDDAMSRQQDRLSVTLAVLAGTCVGCVLALVAGFSVLMRRRRAGPFAFATMAILIAVPAAAAGLGADEVNRRGAAKHRAELVGLFEEAVADRQYVRAWLLARKVDGVDGNPNNDLLSTKMKLLSQVVYNDLADVGDQLRADLHDAQLLAVKLTGRPDRDLQVLQVYVMSENTDGLAATLAMRAIASSDDAGADQRPPGFVVGVSDRIGVVACRMAEGLSVRSAGVQEGAGRAVLAEMPAGFWTALETNFGYDVRDLALGEHPACSRSSAGGASGSPGGLAPLISRLAFRDARWKLDAAADTQMVSCFLYRDCRHRLSDEDLTSFSAAGGEPAQTLVHAARLVAIEEFADWFVNKVRLDGPTSAIGGTLPEGRLCLPARRAEIDGANTVVDIAPGPYRPCTKHDSGPIDPARLAELLAKPTSRWARYMAEVRAITSPAQFRRLERLQLARRALAIDDALTTFNEFKAAGVVDAGFVALDRQSRSDILVGNQVEDQLRKLFEEGGVVVLAWPIASSIREELSRSSAKRLAALKVCLDEGGRLVRCSPGLGKVVPLLYATHVAGALAGKLDAADLEAFAGRT